MRVDVGAHALGVHAFVCRNPDENHEVVYRWLLEKNLKLYAVAFAVDATGDIYLDARLPLAAAAEDLDRVLGTVLATADESFNTILELGFASSIRKEWDWRRARGESTANLEAFRGWLEAGDGDRALGSGEHRGQRQQRRHRLHHEDPLVDRGGAVRPGDDHAHQEEDLHVGAVGDQPPDQAGGQEPVVEALVGGQHLALLGERRVGAEDLTPGRLGPQEHLEDQEAEVQDRDEGDEDGGEGAHRCSMAASGAGGVSFAGFRGLRRATATPTSASAPPAYAIVGGASLRNSTPITMVIGGTRYVVMPRLLALMWRSAKAYVVNAIAVGKTPR